MAAAPAAVPPAPGPAGPRALSSPGAPLPAGVRGRGASLAPPTIWQSPRRGSSRSSSRGVQNLSRPGVTRGRKTISGSGVLGPGPDGGGAGIRAEPPAQPLSEPAARAGRGPEVTQRSRRDKRHPPALAPIPGAPRPLTSLRRPPRTPLSPPGQSFRWPGSDPNNGSVLAPTAPPPPARGPFPPSPPPLPLPPARFPSPPQSALSGAHRGAGGPRPRSPAAGPARGEGAGWGRPRSAPHLPCSHDRALCSFSRSLFRSSRRFGTQLSALRSLALRKLQTTPRAFPARRLPPSTALAAPRPVWSPPASVEAEPPASPRRPSGRPGLATFSRCSGTSEMVRGRC